MQRRHTLTTHRHTHTHMHHNPIRFPLKSYAILLHRKSLLILVVLLHIAVICSYFFILITFKKVRRTYSDKLISYDCPLTWHSWGSCLEITSRQRLKMHRKQDHLSLNAAHRGGFLSDLFHTLVIHVYPSGGWSWTKPTLVERWGSPRTDYPFITKLTHSQWRTDIYSHTHSLGQV